MAVWPFKFISIREGDYIFKGPNSNWTYRGQLEGPSPNGTRDQMEFM